MLQAVFPVVRFSEVEEDVNRILFASKSNILDSRLSEKSAQTKIDTQARSLNADQISALLEEISTLDLRS